jgi:oligopeptidase B
MVYRKDMEKNGENRCYFTHTALTTSMDAFHFDRLSLLDRGFIYAIAHIRGGDLGRQWYDDGKLLKKKKNTFTDFIDCSICNSYILLYQLYLYEDQREDC